MDYEKIILELLSRIQILEGKVEELSEKNNTAEKVSVTTNDICNYISKLKICAKSEGRNKIVLVSRDIHKQLDLKNKYPMVCNAMRRCMNENDFIIFQPPKGNSSTLKIEYKL